jgi:hypothetical protein
MRKLNSCLAVLPFALAVVGCTSDSPPTPGDEGVVTADVALSTDRTVIPLRVGGDALTPKMIRGRYGPRCTVHAGETWDLMLNNWRDGSVEVALNDTIKNCPLVITDVAAMVGKRLVVFPVSPPIKLGNDFAEDPSQIDHADGRLAFFANAKLWGVRTGEYLNNFIIEFVYSDDAKACREVAPSAVIGTMGAAAVGVDVAPPNYDMTFDGMKIMVDAQHRVLASSTGSATLVLPSKYAQAGEEWRVFDETTLCCLSWSFGEIDQLFNQGEPVSHGAIEGTSSFKIPWNGFDLLGETLPLKRSMIVKHTGEGGVYSYELFQVRFPGPNWD